MASACTSVMRQKPLRSRCSCVNGLSFLHRYPFANDLMTFFARFWTVRSTGGCLDAMLVASGKADAWIEAQAKPWDLAPLKVIVEEAGAVTFDFAGKDTIYGGNFNRDRSSRLASR